MSKAKGATICLALVLSLICSATGSPPNRPQWGARKEQGFLVTLNSPLVLERGTLWKAKVSFANLGDRPCVFSKHPGMLRLVFSDAKGDRVAHLNSDACWRGEATTDLVYVKPKETVELTLGVRPEAHAFVKPGNYRVAVQCTPVTNGVKRKAKLAPSNTLSFPVRRFVSDWAEVVVLPGFISTRSPTDDFYRELMTVPLARQGLSASLGFPDPDSRQTRFSAALILANEGEKPIAIDNRLCHQSNVFLYFFDATNRLVTYKNWSVRMSQTAPQSQSDLTVLAPKQVLKFEDLFKHLEPVPAGKYTVISMYNAPNGVGDTPFKGQYWTGVVRTNPVKVVISGE